MDSVMVYLDGSKKSFRCHCGCNVFHKPKPSLYKCNACGEIYEGTGKANVAKEAVALDVPDKPHSDGSYRVHCSNCGAVVSSPLTTPVVVRAYVKCPDCIEKEANGTGATAQGRGE